MHISPNTCYMLSPSQFTAQDYIKKQISSDVKLKKKNTHLKYKREAKIKQSLVHTSRHTYIRLFPFDKERYSPGLFSKINCLVITKFLHQILWRYESWIKHFLIPL